MRAVKGPLGLLTSYKLVLLWRGPRNGADIDADEIAVHIIDRKDGDIHLSRSVRIQ